MEKENNKFLNSPKQFNVCIKENKKIKTKYSKKSPKIKKSTAKYQSIIEEEIDLSYNEATLTKKQQFFKTTPPLGKVKKKSLVF